MSPTGPGLAKRERSVLITIDTGRKDGWSLESMKNELRELVLSCGADILAEVECRCRGPNARLLIGKGKAEELASVVAREGADVVIFGSELSPSQQQNLEELLEAKTIDRTQLILDIFAQRARTSEAKLQVELAQLEYLLPRLRGRGIELSRLGGGLGTRGPGEQKLEVDRRRIRSRIGHLKKELVKVARGRAVRRKKRIGESILSIALVGYTNSGKSTLFNRLTASGVLTRDGLFSTLDPTTRKLRLEGGQKVLISDTVGFLHELPHHLIESFKTTLEEVVDADVLFHVIDMSDPLAELHRDSVLEVLKEIEAVDKSIVPVLNKSDLVTSPLRKRRLERAFPGSVVLSALEGEGMEDLKEVVFGLVRKDMEDLEIELGHDDLDLLELVRKHGIIKKENFTENGVELRAALPRKTKYSLLKRLRER